MSGSQSALGPPFTLNPEQEHVFECLTTFCTDISTNQSKQLIITGSAGTGKTSIIIYYIISSWLNTKPAILDVNYILCAPTNKAKDVMYNKYMEYISPILRNKKNTDHDLLELYPTLKRKLYKSVQFKTISQVLGINIQINNDGLQEFSKGDQTKIIQKYMNNPEYENTVIIIDESSMVDANCAAKLAFIPRPVIYLGDRCQLPPVNEESSTIFTYSPGPACDIVNLTKVERAQGAIVTVSNHLRDRMLSNPMLPNLIELISPAQTSTHLTDGTICLYPSKPNLWLNTYLARIISQPAVPDMGLTWTNSRCSILNNKMRCLIYNWEMSQLASSPLEETQPPPFLMKNEKIIVKDAFYQYGDKLYSSMVLYLAHISPEIQYTPLSFMEWINCTYYSYLINSSASSIMGSHNITYKPLNLDMLNSFKPVTHAAAKSKKLTPAKGKTLADYGFVKGKHAKTTTGSESTITDSPAEQLSKQLNTLRCTFIPDYPYYNITSTAEKGVITTDKLAMRNTVKSTAAQQCNIDMFQLFMEAKNYSTSEMFEFTNTGLPTEDFKEYHMFATRKLFGIPVEKVCCPLCEFLMPKLIPFIQEHDTDVYRLIQLTHGLELSCHNCKSKASTQSKTQSSAFNLSLLTPAGQERYIMIEQEVRTILQNCSAKKITLTKAEYTRFNTLLEQENTSLIGLSNTTPFVNLSYILGHYWSHCFADIFAKWDYGYFITIHKSQGSDYDNVFLDYFDLVSNPKQNERDRLIYTGLTRAKSKCHIYCK
jgi:hypothetical protein